MPIQSSSRKLHQRVSESAAAVQELFTLNSLNQSFSTQYRRRTAIAFVLYFVIGIGYYTGREKFTVLDSIYFSVTTILTIGYGDLTPHTSYQRIFTIFYIFLGILIISAVVGSVTEVLYEKHQESIDQGVKRAASKMKSFEENPNYQKVLEFLDVSDTGRNESSSFSEGCISSSIDSFSRVRSSMDDEATAFRGINGFSTLPSQGASEKRMLAAMQKLNMEMFDEELKDIELRAKRDIVVVFGIVVFGCVAMLGIERWYFGEALYWAVTTITTVGFGDVVPQTNSGKVFTIIYCIAGCAVLASGINDLIRYPLLVKSKQNELRVMTQFGGELSEETLRGILTNNFFERIPDIRQKSTSINKGEFILMVLGMMNKIHDKDVIIASKVFDILDEAKEGVLSAEHIVSKIARVQAIEEQCKLKEEKSNSYRLSETSQNHDSSRRVCTIGNELSNPLIDGATTDAQYRPLMQVVEEVFYNSRTIIHKPEELETAACGEHNV